MDFHMVLEYVLWTIMGISLPMVNTCLAKKLPHVNGVLKCHISPRDA
jgi:hypothetical protein